MAPLTLPTDLSSLVSSLNHLIDQIRERDSALNSRLSVLEQRVEAVYTTSCESQHSIRGNNGDPGLVGRVYNLEKEVASIAPILTDFQKTLQEIQARPCRMQDRIMALEEGQTQSERLSDRTRLENVVAEATSADHVVRWTEIRDKVVWPLILVLTGGIITLLVQHGISLQP